MRPRRTAPDGAQCSPPVCRYWPVLPTGGLAGGHPKGEPAGATNDPFARRGDPGHHRLMILGDELREDVAADLRTMALHLETAAVLDLKARRTTDPAQVTTLRRRAEQRRRQAARIRSRLAARGAAVPEPTR